MRDNQSDGEGGWERPRGYVNPWASRDEDEAAGTPAAEASAAPPPEISHQDTIAFGGPDSQTWYTSQPEPGGAGQGWYSNQSAPDNQTWYASQPEPGPGGQPGYGTTPGYRSQPSAEPAGHENTPGYGGGGGYPGPGGAPEAGGGFGAAGSGAGFGAAGWGPPDPPARRPKRGGRFVVYIAVAALAASIGAGVTVAVDGHGSAGLTASAGSTSGVSARNVPGPHNNAAGSGSSAAPFNVAAVEKKVDPGLVDVTSTLKYSSETAEGTGMILESSGLVLTNNHVIDGATNIHATLVDPADNATATYPAQVVGYDNTDDVALLQLEGATNLPTVRFGNSAQVRLGTPVLALGNAEGRGGATPAKGIINALNRRIQASDEGSDSTENLNHMLQTNAQIQQGDSGGALANNAGQVIGMITAANNSTASQAGQSGGTLGFAIPINSALAIAKQIASGKPTSTVYIGLPGFLGVEVAQSSSPVPAQQKADAEQGTGRSTPGNGLGCQTTNQQSSVPGRIAPAGSGALVLGVLCNTVANVAGLVAGDVITSVAGQPITTPQSLTSITAKYHPGDVVSVTWEDLNGASHSRMMKLDSGPAR